MKKLKLRRHVIINGTMFYHGDYITGYIGNEENDDEELQFVEDARVCINKSDTDASGKAKRFWICQNIRQGCTNADERFGYEYSWVVTLNNFNEITSTDASDIELKERCSPQDLELEEENESTNTQEVVDEDVDDDPMPDDWVPSEKDLLFLKN